LLSQGQAKAVLTYSIFESGGNLVVETSGSLNLTGAQANGNADCGGGLNGGISSSGAEICTGTYPGSPQNAFTISGPGNFNGSVFYLGADSVSGIFTNIHGSLNYLGLDTAYVSNTPIVSSATINGTTLAGLGFTTTGLIGTWSLTGTSETINVYLVNPATAAVPGPLPLLGAGAAFGWSRRMRKRISATLSTPPQA
jgi:MYXO-CTERM domain-containing protein